MNARVAVPAMSDILVGTPADAPEPDVSIARRRAERIRMLAGAVADNLAKVRELVQEAKNASDHVALGYSSWTAYISDLFGDEPLRLARDVRQELVAELAAQGMSTRAIAPIVGVDQATIVRDVARGDASASPEPRPVVAVIADADTGEVIDDVPAPREPAPVVGLDGKTYEQKPREPKPVLAGESLAQFDAEKNSKALGAALMSMYALTFPEHREHMLTIWWPAGKDAVPPTAREMFTPQRMREFAGALFEFAREMEV